MHPNLHVKYMQLIKKLHILYIINLYNFHFNLVSSDASEFLWGVGDIYFTVVPENEQIWDKCQRDRIPTTRKNKGKSQI